MTFVHGKICIEYQIKAKKVCFNEKQNKLYNNIAKYIVKHDRISRHMSRSTSDIYIYIYIYINHLYREFHFSNRKKHAEYKMDTSV
jgi:hypothetical protein